MEKRSAPRGSGNLTYAFVTGVLLAAGGTVLAYFIGGRASTPGSLLLSGFAGMAAGIAGAWRVYRRGWKTLGTGD
jgi:hypothetical protein